MPEIKNTFLKSKMNKDLDSRIIPNGEYRDGQNVSISASEGSTVGALENIRGNVKLSDFGLNDKNLECIGYYSDVFNDRIFLFITNFADGGTSNFSVNLSGSSSSLGKVFNRVSSSNYIICCDLSNDVLSSTILVSGAFLNFSINAPICGVNLVEDLLFWTDNRNQPRKINVKTALSNPFINSTQPGYYYNEDHISVAKYAPHSSISFIKNTKGYIESTLKNEVDEYLPPIFSAPSTVATSDFFEGGIKVDILKFNFNEKNISDNKSYSSISNFLSDQTQRGPETGSQLIGGKIKVTIAGNKNGSSAFVRRIIPSDPSNNKGDRVWLEDENGNVIVDFEKELGWFASKVPLDDDGNEKPKDSNKGVLVPMFSTKNLDYNSSFSGDKKYLEQKFARFSYRFKYDDNEYSLPASYSQHAFVPKQFGYFVGVDDKVTKESSVVEFMENQITTAGLVVDLPCAPDKILDEYKVKEIQFLFKASDEEAVKVLAEVDTTSPNNIKGIPKSISIKNSSGTGYSTGVKNTTGGSGSGLTVRVLNVSATSGAIDSVIIENSGDGYTKNDIIEVDGGTTKASISIVELENKYIYNYTSQKPIKVLPSKDLVRVSDIVPLVAKTQESVGNRILYGNFLQNKETPKSLKYSVSAVVKGSGDDSSLDIELNNHTLKQGRSYQVGVVLQDRYGRSSNVILNDDNDDFFTSSFTAPYTNGGADPLAWPGNSLNVTFQNKIPELKTSTYSGLWDPIDNPTGWYTYKIVVKQQEQDYYNVYTPGALSGNVVFTKWTEKLEYQNEYSFSNLVLIGNNVNKVPRNLKKAGPLDKVFTSDTTLRNRVSQNNRFSELFTSDSTDVTDESGRIYADLNSQNFTVKDQEVNTLREYNELGPWVTYKNVNLKFGLLGQNQESQEITTDTYVYPGPKGEIDPLFLKSTKNPIIATINTKDIRVGSSARDQKDRFYFSKELNVFETNPFKSNIDIYYETSTCGKIEDLNNSIEQSIGQPADVMSDISFIQSMFFEDLEPGSSIDYASSEFNVLSASGNVLQDFSCNITIDSMSREVVTGFNLGSGFTTGLIPISDPSDFPIDITTLTPAVAPSTPATFIFFRKNPIAFKTPLTNNKLSVVLRASCDNQPDITKTVEIVLTNKQPIINRVGFPPKIGFPGAGGFERLYPADGGFKNNKYNYNFLYNHKTDVDNVWTTTYPNQDGLFSWPFSRVGPKSTPASDDDHGVWISTNYVHVASGYLSTPLCTIAFSTNGAETLEFPIPGDPPPSFKSDMDILSENSSEDNRTTGMIYKIKSIIASTAATLGNSTTGDPSSIRSYVNEKNNTLNPLLQKQLTNDSIIDFPEPLGGDFDIRLSDFYFAKTTKTTFNLIEGQRDITFQALHVRLSPTAVSQLRRFNELEGIEELGLQFRVTISAVDAGGSREGKESEDVIIYTTLFITD